MREYYCITQLTGIGQEALLDPVDSSLIAWFEDGWLFGIGSPKALQGQDAVATKIAA